jgi:ribosomal protein S1
VEASVRRRSARRGQDHRVCLVSGSESQLSLTIFSHSRRVDKVQNQVELSLRKNAEVKTVSLELGDLTKGQVVKGVVKRVEAYGAFIRIDGSNINGLCHKSKV